MQQIQSLTDIADQVDTFFIDMFGVLWDGAAFYPEALTVCQNLIQLGKKIYVMSNTTMIGHHFKEKHIPHGFIQGVHYTDVISSGDVLKFMLENTSFMDEVVGSRHGKYALIGRPNNELLSSVLHRQTLEITKAKAVYVGSLQLQKNNNFISQTTIQAFIPAAQQALKLHLPMICANPDYFAFIKGEKHVTQGSLAKWYEDHKGKVYWIGKPYQNIYDYALKTTKTPANKCAMVGDTIRTDILGGFKAGMKTVLTLKHGVSQDLLNRGHSLEQIAINEGAFPDFTIEGLK